MSSVRMCDKCSRVFSENEEGWQTASLQTVEYDDSGNQITVPIRHDLCSDCAVETPRRRNAGVEDRIAALEADNERLDKLTKQIENVGK